jgi:Cu-processing system ATP-binding protein
MPQVGRYPENMKVSQLFGMLRDMREGSYAETDEELVKEYEIEKIFDKSLGSLSGGTVQKVSAAIAFLFRPKVLILDEPTAGLDPVAAEILKDKIHRDSENRLVLITSHILNDLDELATHLLFLHEGRVRFMEPVQDLRQAHGENKLGRIISAMMLKDQLTGTHD